MACLSVVKVYDLDDYWFSEGDSGLGRGNVCQEEHTTYEDHEWEKFKHEKLASC
jgi:hypothetical protein